MKCIIALCLLLLGLHNLDPKLCIGKGDCFNRLEEPLLSFSFVFSISAASKYLQVSVWHVFKCFFKIIEYCPLNSFYTTNQTISTFHSTHTFVLDLIVPEVVPHSS